MAFEGHCGGWFNTQFLWIPIHHKNVEITDFKVVQRCVKYINSLADLVSCFDTFIMTINMSFSCRWVFKGCCTVYARIRPFPCMDSLMSFSCTWILKFFCTVFARKRFFTSMCTFMPSSWIFIFENFSTEIAGINLLVWVNFLFT